MSGPHTSAIAGACWWTGGEADVGCHLPYKPRTALDVYHSNSVQGTLRQGGGFVTS